MWILLTAADDDWCNSISQAGNKEIKQLSDHTYCSDLAKLHNAGRRIWMKQPLIGSVSWDHVPFCLEFLLEAQRHFNLFPHNYKLLMLCNLARQNLGWCDSLMTLADETFFFFPFPVASLKRPCLIMVQLGFYLWGWTCYHWNNSALCFHSQEAPFPSC